MHIPDCYDPAVQEAANALAHTAKVMRRPRCERCGSPLMGEIYLDLEPFGLKGYACEKCLDKHSHDVGDLDEEV